MSSGERFHISESDLTAAAAAADDEGDRSNLPPVMTAQMPSSSSDTETKKTTCILVVGMAGSGKTTLMSQIFRSLSQPSSTEEEEEEDENDGLLQQSSEDDNKSDKKPVAEQVETNRVEGEKDDDDDDDDGTTEEGEGSSGKDKRVGYFLNLDPATKSVPFGASIDIRDTVDYKEVMKQHNLGPNGAIMTSLNLFATKFDQVINILEKRAFGHDTTTTPDDTNHKKENLDYIVVDTPGQIEAFTWSASGTIMSEGLASSFPTVLAFVVDTPRCAASPNTFMSNMLYACSMLYRTRLPLVIVFNKTDVVPHDFAKEWMTDYEAFQEALDEHSSESGYYGSLTRSLSLVLDEFYCNLHHCGVSAATGDGMEDFWNAVDAASKDFVTDYLPDLKNRIEEQKAKKRAIARDGAKRLAKDMAETTIQDNDCNS